MTLNHKFFIGDEIVVPVEGELSQFKTLTRGDEQTFEFYLRGDLDSGAISSGATAGGTTGGTAGGTTGFTASSSSVTLQTAQSRYERLMDYLDYVGSVTSSTTLDGEPRYREFVTDQADVETFVVPFAPSQDLQSQNVPGFWGLLTDGTDQTEIFGSQARVDMTAVVLAELDEYETTTDVQDAFSVDP